MIGKVTGGSKPSGILNYCYYEKDKLSEAMKERLRPEDVRGEIVYIQHLSLSTLSDGRFDMEYLAKQFKACANLNRDLKNYVWHQSFSFPQGEAPTKEQIQDIAIAFAKDFGFEDNQLIAFQHKDTSHAHFHIVANRINHEGKTTADDGYSYLRTGTFCRKIELEMGLQITPNMHLLEKEKSISESQIAALMRAKVKLHLSQSKSIKELSTKLKKEGIKTHIGRGIAFTLTAKGVTFKGSDLGREYSLANLEKRLQEEVLKMQAQANNQVMQQNNALMNQQRLEEEQKQEKRKTIRMKR